MKKWIWICMKWIMIINMCIYMNMMRCDGYIQRFRIKSKNDICKSVCSFMDLNDIINNRDRGEFINNLRVRTYNNSSICFTYNTYSKMGYYNYRYTYLLRDKNTYLIKYEIDVDGYIYKYLFFIKSHISRGSYINRTEWDVIMKTNEDKYIENSVIRLLKRCVNKRVDKINPLLINYFK